MVRLRVKLDLNIMSLRSYNQAFEMEITPSTSRRWVNSTFIKKQKKSGKRKAYDSSPVPLNFTNKNGIYHNTEQAVNFEAIYWSKIGQERL